MRNSPGVVAALDLACLMHRLLRKPSRLPVEERKEVRIHYTRALAALAGHDLPQGIIVDKETARAAFEVLCNALSLNGIDNQELVTWFNDSALQRQQPGER